VSLCFEIFITDCNGIFINHSKFILLFEIKTNSNKPYFYLYSVSIHRTQNKHRKLKFKISKQCIKSWNKYYDKPLITIKPMPLTSYKLASCLKLDKNKNPIANNSNNNCIWSLSLCIPDSYLRNIACIKPYLFSASDSNAHYSEWYWWIVVTKQSSNNVTILLIHQKTVISRLPFQCQQIKPLSLISIPQCDTIIFLSEIKSKIEPKNKNVDLFEISEDDDDDIDMKYDNGLSAETLLQCHIIKRDSYHQYKQCVNKTFQQIFDIKNKNQSKDSFYGS